MQMYDDAEDLFLGIPDTSESDLKELTEGLEKLEEENEAWFQENEASLRENEAWLRHYLAEQEVITRRWVDSGFKLGGHLPAEDRKLFDGWVSKVLRESLTDPLAAQAEMEKLRRYSLANSRNIKKYKAWKSKKKSATRKTLLRTPPVLTFLPSAIVT
jgi:hypothetical protein